MRSRRSTDPAARAAAIAQALGVREVDGTIDARCSTFVRERELLLVADNFEQVLAQHRSSTLLAERPVFVVLVTSARRFISPPSTSTPCRRSATTRSALRRPRACGAPASGSTDTQMPSRRSARALDGLPLAIELAAARTRHFTPPALLKRLEQRLPSSPAARAICPSASGPFAPRSTGATACSSEPEQRFLARLSVFNNGFTLDAAEAVCGDDAFETVTALVDHSLVRAGDAGSAEARFALLDTIREFASEQLEASGEADEIRLRHATYFCGDANEVLEIAHWGEARTRWGDESELDTANIRAALDWAHAHHSELELPLALRYQLFPTVYPGECCAVLTDALVSRSGASALRARAFVALAPLCLMQGDLQAAAHAAGEAVRLLRDLGDRPVWEARALHYAALAAFEGGDLARTLQYADELDAFSERNDDSRARSLSLRLRANVALIQGDYEQARTFARERLAVLEDSDSDVWLASAHLYLSQLAVLGGDVGTGVTELEAAAPIVERIAWHNSTCDFIEATAAVLYAAGENCDGGASVLSRGALARRARRGEPRRHDVVPPRANTAAATCSSRRAGYRSIAKSAKPHSR